MNNVWFTIFLICSNIVVSFSQNQVTIGLVTDGASASNNFLEESVKNEINSLLQFQYDISYKTLTSNGVDTSIKEHFQAMYDDPAVNIVIGVGILASNELVQLKNYPKPSIATITIDASLQDLPASNQTTSGVNNFTYSESPFDIKRDLEVFKEVYDFQRLGILMTEKLATANTNWQQFLKEEFNMDAQIITVENNGNVSNWSNIDAIYVLPPIGIESTAFIKLVEQINDKKFPSFALQGRSLTEAGIMASLAPQSNVTVITRRVALNVAKILEGTNASALPVAVETYHEDFVINVSTAKKIGHYPNWNVLAKATLLYLGEVETDNVWSLKSTIYEALRKNLELEVAKKEVDANRFEINKARSNYLPQSNLFSNLVFIDSTRAANSFGSAAPITWTASADLTQVIVSEPVLANIQIQKLLQKSQEYSRDQVQLDVIQDAASAYLQVLQAQTLLQLQNSNVSVTKNNLDIAQTKEAVGYSGVSDVYRWESELALNNIDLNNAQAQMRQAKLFFNQLLNHPLTEAFRTEDIALTDSLLRIYDERVIPYLDNPDKLSKFADFLVIEAFRNLPELGQIEMGIAAQERSLVSQKRAYYLPSVFATGQVDYNLARINAAEPTAIELPPPTGTVTIGGEPASLQWNMAVGVQIPLVQGLERNAQRQQTAVNILKLNDQRQEFENKLDFQVRANLETLGASYSGVQLYQEASVAAKKNFEIAQQSYQQGLISVIQLIDAQKASLQTEIAARNAIYQFINDFFAVERSIGVYIFLLPPNEQNAFFERFAAFVTQN